MGNQPVTPQVEAVPMAPTVTTVATEIVRPVIVELTKGDIMFMDCDGFTGILPQEDLNNIMKELNLPLNPEQTLKDKCLSIRRKLIKEEDERQTIERSKKRPLAFDSFNTMNCDEISSSYSVDEMAKFFNEHKASLGDWVPDIEPYVNKGGYYDRNNVCRLTRSALLSKKLIRPNDKERISLDRLESRQKFATQQKLKELSDQLTKK